MGNIAEDFKVKMKNRPAGFIGELTRRLRRSLRNNTPVITGRLRRGWKARGTNDGTVKAWNNVDYADYVDERGRSSGYASDILNQRVVNAIAKDVQEDLE